MALIVSTWVQIITQTLAVQPIFECIFASPRHSHAGKAKENDSQIEIWNRPYVHFEVLLWSKLTFFQVGSNVFGSVLPSDRSRLTILSLLPCIGKGGIVEKYFDAFGTYFNAPRKTPLSALFFPRCSARIRVAPLLRQICVKILDFFSPEDAHNDLR